MFILDSGNSRIQKWFPSATFGTTVLAATMGTPLGMHLDVFGNLAVADTNYHRIQLYGVWCRKFDDSCRIGFFSIRRVSPSL